MSADGISFVETKLEIPKPPLPVGKYLKRLFDLIISALLIIIFLVVGVVIAIAIKYSDPGPILFRQTRIGYQGRRFQCLKFRTMKLNAEAALPEIFERDEAAKHEWTVSHRLTCDPRATRVGRFMRRTKLDELPQLINILRGEMSLVGPRPITEEEVHRYGPHFQDYLSVRPGLTGLWQVNDFKGCTYARRVELDLAYIRKQSFLGDMAILGRTLPAIFRSIRGN